MDRRALVGAAVIGAGLLGASAAHASPRMPAIGVMTDVGVPDGATVSLVYRPVAPLRVSVGASHNLVGPGVRAGITLAPVPFWVSPTWSLSVGHFAERDANPVARMVTGDATYSSPALEQFGYNYAEAHVGLAFGRRRASFYLDGGVARVVGNVRNLAALGAGSEPDEDDLTSVSYTEDPSVTVTTLSARVGLVIYIP
jgi:hypothetical protein